MWPKLTIQKYQKILAEKGKQEEENELDLQEEKPLNNSDLQTPHEQKRFPKVNLYDVEEIALMVRYNLVLNRISVDKIIDVFIIKLIYILY